MATDGAECGFVSFDAIMHATSGYVKYVSCLSDPTLVDTDGDVFDQITATMKSTEGSMRWDLSNCIDTFVNRSRADYRALP